MKIAYLISEDLGVHPGLKYKILSQIDFWKSQNVEVYTVLLTDGIIVNPNGTEVNIPIPKKHWKLSNRKRFLFEIISEKYLDAIEALKLINPDITYSRYLFPARYVNKIHMYTNKLIFEINSDDCSEYLQKSKITGIYNLLLRKYSLNKANGFVFVTDELSESSSFQFAGVHKTVIANGINTKDFEFLLVANNKTPQLVFIGSPGQSWHGLDKIYTLIKELPYCNFNIVGPSKDSCIQLWNDAPHNVTYHGYLSGSDSKKILKTMDIGIGTLALHRKKMHEACALKVRQYLAHGLPVIGASKDTDIPAKSSFYLELPNTEMNIKENIMIIKQFIDESYGNAELRLQARKFAEENLASYVKEKKRLVFFKRVLR